MASGVGFDGGALGGVELAVEVGAGQLGVHRGRVVVAHGALLGRSGSVRLVPGVGAPAAAASAARPRAMRLFTVPTGMSSTAAISA